MKNFRNRALVVGCYLLAACASDDDVNGPPGAGGYPGYGGQPAGGSGGAGNGGAANGGVANGGVAAAGGMSAGAFPNGGLPTTGSGGVGGSISGGGGTVANGGSPSGGLPSGGTGNGGNPSAGGSVVGGAPGTGGAPNAACGTNLLPLPDDPSVRGPWDVGVRTVKAGRVTAEILYPAQPGSTAGKPEAKYDLRDWLPQRERGKVPDNASPQVGPIGGHLFRDVPLDTDHGPYPVVIMIHGTASVRIASGSTNVHWASHGFVVVAADYPGLGLADQLSATAQCSLPQSGAQDIPGDVRAQIAAVTAGTGDFAFLMGKADTKRLGIAGHSQGACMAATLANVPGVRIVLPFTGSTPVGVPAPPDLKSLIWIAGLNDTVIGYDQALIGNTVCPAFAVSNVAAYNASPGPPQVVKRLVGISGGGHLVPTDLCQTNQFNRNAIQESQKDGVCGINSAVIIGLPSLFDCGTIPMASGINAVNYASTAALEETLHCQDRSKQFADMRTRVSVIGDFRHAP